jgi:hypothetical protein
MQTSAIVAALWISALMSFIHRASIARLLRNTHCGGERKSFFVASYRTL